MSACDQLALLVFGVAGAAGTSALNFILGNPFAGLFLAAAAIYGYFQIEGLRQQCIRERQEA